MYVDGWWELINFSGHSFPLTFIFKYIFVKILLMTFFYISILLKTSNILENISQVFESLKVIAKLHNDPYYNELGNLNETKQRYGIKSDFK